MKKLLSLFMAILMVIGVSATIVGAVDTSAEKLDYETIARLKTGSLEGEPEVISAAQDGTIGASYSVNLPFEKDGTFTSSTTTTTVGGRSVYYDEYYVYIKAGQTFTMYLVADFDIALQYPGAGGVTTTAYSTEVFQGTYYIERAFTASESSTFRFVVTQRTKSTGYYYITSAYVPTSIKVTPAKATINVDEIISAEATISPSTADQMIEWYSSDYNVADVDYEGTIIGVGPGTAIITACAYGDSDVKGTMTVTVRQPVTGITVTPSDAEVYVGRSVAITANVTPANAANKNITYTSSNESVASVFNGSVIGVSPGTATITVASAENPDIKKTVTIRVKPITSGMVDIKRLFGRSRYDTAVNIAGEGWTTSDTVILASGTQFADALSGAVLAAQLDAPIILTAKDALEISAKSKIDSLKPTKVIILGGVGAISKDIETALSKYEIVRLGGANRYETSAVISQYLIDNMETAPNTVFVTAGHSFADALSVSSYAGIKGYPIVYAQKDADLDAQVKKFVESGFENAVILGGTNAVTSNIETQLNTIGIKNVDRIFGSTRYQTSMAIVNKYSSEFGNNISIATGTNFPDALAGSVLAAKNKTPLILTGPTSDPANGIIDEAKTYIKNVKPDTIYIFGGESAVPAKWITDIVD